MPMLMAFDGALSPRFAELHAKWRTPYLVLIIQACLCSVLLVLARSGETLRNAWQLLMDMSILTLFVPFICMFGAAWRFGSRVSASSGVFSFGAFHGIGARSAIRARIDPAVRIKAHRRYRPAYENRSYRLPQGAGRQWILYGTDDRVL
jgi:amino acid transporter